MHLLLFHEVAQTDSTHDNRAEVDTIAETFSVKPPRREAHSVAQSGAVLLSSRPIVEGEEADRTQDGLNLLRVGNEVRRPPLARGGSRPSSAVAGNNARFTTAGRVRDFRAILKGAAAHASKMKVQNCV